MSKESAVEPQEESAPTETQPVADTQVAAAEPDTDVNGGEGLDDENTVEEDADLADSFDEMDAAFNAAIEFKGKPTAIIAKSVKGKGVSFMENQCSWHGKAPNEEQYKEAMEELNAPLTSLEAN